MTPAKRKKMEKLIYDYYDKADPSGINTEYYRNIFSPMSDKEFDNFFKAFFKNPDEYLIYNMTDGKNELTMGSCENAAKLLGVPIEETLYMPHITMDKKNVIATKHKVIVGYCNVKRPQQFLFKKNGMSTTAEKRSALTNQVIDADKNGRQTDMENLMLLVRDSDALMKEFDGIKADDSYMKQQAVGQIVKDGYLSIKDLTDDVSNKTTLNTVDVYLLGMSIKSDLVTKGLMLTKTIKDQT